MNNEKMTNQSFRDRLGIEEKNYSIVSRIIRETINAGLIKGYTSEFIAKKAISYIPFWG